MLLINCGQSPVLIRNDGGNRNNWLGLALIGKESNRDAIGAKVTVKAGQWSATRTLAGGDGYCSAHDRRILIGLGAREGVDLIEVRWPSGKVDRIQPPAINRYVKLIEGSAKPVARSNTLTPRPSAEAIAVP